MNKKLILLFLFFFLVQIPIIFYSNLPADEMVYYAISREVSKGNDLYTDIFFSHPPLQIYAYTLTSDLFGFHIWLLKSITLLFALGCAYFVYRITEEKYGERSAFIALLIFITSYDILIFGSFAFGIEMATFFFLASYYYLNKKERISGILFAFCIMSRLHLAFLGVILFLFCKKKLKFLSGAAIVLIYYIPLLTIPNFLASILGYHTSKEFFFGGWWAYFKSSILLWVLFFFSLKYVDRKDIKLLFIGGTYLLFLLLMKSTFEYYFLLITTILAIEGSQAIIHSKYKRVFKLMIAAFIIILLVKSTPFMIDQTKVHNEFVDYINTLEDRPLVGQSAITALLAIKTNRTILNNQIDTNFQRRAVYNYSGAITIYDRTVFTGQMFNCTLIRDYDVEDIIYGVWLC